MNIQKSSFSGDESELSLFVNVPKSQAQVKCQQLMKQSSQYRSLIRQLKQDNEWLRTTNQGLQNQCITIKQILQQKKSMLVQINSDLRLANQQINRLQDQVLEKEQEIGQLKTCIIQRQSDLKKKNQTIAQIQAQLSSLKKQIQAVWKEKQITKNQFEIKYKQQFDVIQQKMLVVLEKYDKKYAKQYQTLESSTKNYEQILNYFNLRLQKCTERQNKINMDHGEQMRKLIKQKEEKVQCIQILELQLQQVNDLLQEYQEEAMKRSKKITDMQQKLSLTQKSSSKNIEQLTQYYQQSLSKILSLFSPLMSPAENQFSRIGQLVRNNKSQFQLDLILQQIKPIVKACSQEKSQRLRKSKQIKQWASKIKEIEQEYDTLKLKHLALQRQYQAVVDDNRRILKFNQLSRFRTQRNIKSMNKQNLSSQNNSNNAPIAKK